MATDLDIVRPGSCEDDPEPERGINLSNVENDDKAVGEENCNKQTCLMNRPMNHPL